MTSPDERFMMLAIEQAQLARQGGDVPFGAVVVRSGEVVVAARNSEHLDVDVTSHAETKAVSQACRVLGRRDLSDCTLYATNEPCIMCAMAIFSACVPRVVYALSRDDLPQIFRPRHIRLAQLLQDTQHAPQVVSGVGRAQALRTWEGIRDPFRVVPTAMPPQP